ncbi:hypothetical protein, partial [Listeria monocytogenes]|uniref:hypothetical protein n=1 Tax=Listeria monocytogenes TaxID=1639 RepID=UPI00243420B1
LDVLRGVKEKIDDLDSEISTSGSLRPTFGDILTLQKYMIALSTTYGANHKALDFIKKNFTTINDIDFTTQKIIDLKRQIPRSTTPNRLSNFPWQCWK